MTIIISLILKQKFLTGLHFVGTWKVVISETSYLIGLQLSLGNSVLKSPRWFLFSALYKWDFKESHL